MRRAVPRLPFVPAERLRAGPMLFEMNSLSRYGK
jgi:hypothetical protein